MQEIVANEFGGSEAQSHYFVRVVFDCPCGKEHRQLVNGGEGGLPESVIVMPSCGREAVRVTAPDASAWTKMLNRARRK